ncbi:macro domain-containing protein [Streptomyces sp. NPDC046931]|uniref:macro domain-containing protein n=1 Tax=Streptomyces sp. NPDC046931 TaxID=3154806 RepID=UPI00340A94FF
MRSLPSHQSLVEELRGLRRPGLPKLRRCTRESLRTAAVAAGLCRGEEDEQDGIEALLAAAVRRLAGGNPLRDDSSCDPMARAAAHSFGIFADRRGAPGADRRKAAAAVFGVTTERFRKSQERDVMVDLAAAILALAREAGGRVSGRPLPSAAATPRSPAPEPARETAAPVRVTDRITVRVCPIEQMRDVDVLVSSENTYLEMSKTFRPTVSGALRRAAAVRDTSGEIVDDVLARELSVWLRRNGRTGMAVPPGTVVATSSGALAAQGVRRILHAAIATPSGNGDSYHVTPAVLAEAVRACFELACRERDFLSIPLSTIAFPLLGAGRGGLSPEIAARWLLWAVREELRQDPGWSVHLVTRRQEHAELLKAASSVR